MQKSQDHPNDFSMQQAMQLARSPAGQQLIALMQRSDGPEFRQAMELASAGKFQEAAKILSSFMASPEAQTLLKQMEK